MSAQRISSPRVVDLASAAVRRVPWRRVRTRRVGALGVLGARRVGARSLLGRSLAPAVSLLVLFAAFGLLPERAVRAADPQPYEVHLQSSGNGTLNALLKASSQLVSLRRTAPVGPFALIDRAEQDIPRLQAALDSYGYYRARIRVSIQGRDLSDPGLPQLLLALPAKRRARINIGFDLGPQFRLRTIRIEGSVSAAARAAFGLASGAPIIASRVVAARDRLLRAMEDGGHAYATVSQPVLYQDATAPVMDLTLTVHPGPLYHLGAIGFEGLHSVSEAFLRRVLTVHTGDLYSPDKIESARTNLLGLDVFSSVSVRQPPQGEVSGGVLPLTFVVTERKRHAVSLNGEYSSDLGVLAGASWTDRNLFGEAEQLTVNASAFNIGGSASAGPGYDINGAFNKPDFLRSDQTLQFSMIALKQSLVAYDQTAVTGGVTLTRKLSSVWNVSLGFTVEQETIRQAEIIATEPDRCRAAWVPPPPPPPGQPQVVPPSPSCPYTLVGLPLSARYDSTDLPNPLADATHGMRVSLSMTPTRSLLQGATFVVLQGDASFYFDFAELGWTAPGRSVLALRAIGATARGAGQFSLPPDQRFYAGGSATVRGYAFQSLGPSFPPPDTPGEYPKGGTGLAAGTIEFRQRLWGNFGMAAFIDGGEITVGGPLIQPGCSEGAASAGPVDCVYGLGVGLGPRYYTPIGPIRLDVALPLNRRPNGDRLEAYIGLGQAF